MTLPEASPAETVGVDEQNPWPGLESFAEGDAFFFHGRAEEAAELLRRVRRDPLTILFGRSGLGKTSLLRAGLFPQLRAADYLPFRIRLDHIETAEPLAQQVKTIITNGIEAHEFDAPRPQPDQSLWEYFHTKGADFWSETNRLLTPVLVFDQFEEIFTLGSATETLRARSEMFITELTYLIENRPPADVKAKLENGEIEGGRFSFNEASCKIVLSLREDYLAQLETLRDRIPSIANNRMRIEPMRGEQALEVVVKAGASAQLVAEPVARRIVEFVANADKPDEVDSNDRAAFGQLETDPALLSLFCRKLNDQRLKLGQPQITLDLVQGNSTEILTRFYEDCILALPPETRESARNFVEDRLLTRSGHRDTIALDNALDEPGVTAKIVDELVSRRLLRYDDRAGRRVELAHDVLVSVVRASRDARHQQQKEAAERARAERERAEAQAKADAEHERAERERQEKERAEALAKRAADARASADELISFMVFDLRDKLGSIGQIQLLAEVNDKTLEYFDKLSSDEETNDLKWTEAVALQSRGNIKLDAGFVSDAVNAHKRSLELFRTLSQEPEATESHFYGLATECSSLAWSLAVQGNLAGSHELYQEAFDIVQRSAVKEGATEIWATVRPIYRERLGDVLKAEGKLGEAIKLYQQSLEERQAALALDANDASRAALSDSYIILGDAVRAQGQLAAALKYFEDSLAIRKQLAEENPSDVLRQHNLSQSYDRIGDGRQAFGKINEALAAFNESDQIFMRLTAQDPNNASWNRNFSVTRFRLAEIQSVAGQSAIAADVFSRVLTFRQTLAKLDESNADAQDDLAEAYLRSGDSDILYGRLTEAAEKYRQAGEIRTLLAENEPTNADRQSRLADALERLGDMACLRRNFAEALDCHGRTHEIRDRLATIDAGNLSRLSEVATSKVKLGDAHKLLGQPAKAHDLYEAALKLRENLTVADPDNAQWESRLAVSLGKLAEACAALNETVAAGEYFKKSTEVFRRLIDLSPENAEWQIDAADLVFSASEILLTWGNSTGALGMLRSGLEIREAVAKLDPQNFKRQAELARGLDLTATVVLLAEPTAKAEAAAMMKRALEIMSSFKDKAELSGEQQNWLAVIEKNNLNLPVVVAGAELATPVVSEAPGLASGNGAAEEAPDKK